VLRLKVRIGAVDGRLKLQNLEASIATVMQTLARVLGIAEVLLVPVSILWLLLASVRPSRARAWRSIGLAAGVALTVAQPFGVVAGERSAPPAGARPVNPTSIHVARLAGFLPTLPFTLYHEDYIVSGENGPTAALKARSWFWLPVLTNATTIKDICSNNVVSTPCWGSDGRAYDYPTNLRLSEKAGRYYVTLLNPAARNYSPYDRTSYTWELAPGLASPAGLIYWVVLAVLIPVAVRSTRRRAKNSHSSTDRIP
jgi:hypothetical protein